MTLNDILWLAGEEAEALIEANLTLSPTAIALNRRIPNPALIAEQVKGLARARAKLPQWFAARCLLPARAFEQSSGEAVAGIKGYSGELCIDLTCGLGVDSAHFSKNFRHVVAVERDKVLAAAARENFRRLGISNIDVVCSTAEAFLDEFGGRADLIYVDPDRRTTSGRRIFNPAECSPNVVELMPALLSKGDLIVIKNSPLFDTDEVFRVFGEYCSRVEVVSRDGECREILAEVERGASFRRIAATVCGRDSYEQPYPPPEPQATPFAPPYAHIIIPDAALRAAHLTADFLKRFDPSIYISTNGYSFGNTTINTPFCRSYPITAMLPYSSSAVRTQLRELSINHATIHLCGTRLRLSDVRRDLKLTDGNTAHFFLTDINKKTWAIISK